MCLSADGDLQPITFDERGASLLQQIFACTQVEMKLLPEFPSYLCSACESRLDSLHKFRCLCVLKNKKVERVHEEVDTTNLTAAEITAKPPNIRQTDGVESVWIKTEVVAEHPSEDYQSSETVSNSQQISGTYDYYHRNDLFEAEEVSLETLLKREPMDEEQQPSDADLKHELKTDPSNFSSKGSTLSQMDPSADEDSGYPCHLSVSTVDEQQLCPSNEHRSPQQDITVAEFPELPEHDSKINTDVHRIKQKRHQCPHCPREFVRAGGLKNHIRWHTDEEPFQCEVCGITFYSKQMLMGHASILN
ncbi:zinc finger protein sens-like [Anopheles cruzii]|uniref:zinc finger protein sens-like n=1 Tax=Anopheles cruzii TaxID=68878 RepID=UPI0022EC4E0A|nr:zinc finger protein sens-like [Anopheles cruzii]